MAAIFTMKCDLCGRIQTEEEAYNIKGSMLMMNGATRFACDTCGPLLNGAFVMGAEGLTEPLKKVAKMEEEHRQALLALEQEKANMRSKVSWVETEMRGLKAALERKEQRGVEERQALRLEYEGKIRELEANVQDGKSKKKKR